MMAYLCIVTQYIFKWKKTTIETLKNPILMQNVCHIKMVASAIRSPYSPCSKHIKFCFSTTYSVRGIMGFKISQTLLTTTHNTESRRLVSCKQNFPNTKLKSNYFFPFGKQKNSTELLTFKHYLRTILF